MPIYDIKAPDGKIYSVKAPEGATEQQAIAYLRRTQFKPSAPSEPTSTPTQPELEKSPIEDVLEEIPLVGDFLTGAADVGLGAVQGLAGVTGAATEAFGASSRVSRFFDDIAQGAQALMSAEERGDLAEGQRIMQEAADKGILEQVKAAATAFSKSPLTLSAQAAGSALPFIAATVGTGGGAAVPLALGAVTGAGVVKGSIYDSVESEALKAGLNEEQAAAMADAAQAYGGENLDMIALGTVLGGVAARFGIEGALAKTVGKDIAENVAKNVVTRAVTTGTKEAATEAVQAGQERFAGNLAAQREGFDVPLGRGVAGQAALEGIMGGVPGAAIGAIAGPRQEAVPFTEEEKAAGPDARREELIRGLLTQGIPERQAFAIADAQVIEEENLRAAEKAAKAKAKAKAEAKAEEAAPAEQLELPIEEVETAASVEAAPVEAAPKKKGRGRPAEEARTEEFALQNKALELYPSKNQANPRDAWYNAASGVSLADYTAGASRDLTAASKKAFAEGVKWRESQAAPAVAEEVAVDETPAVDRMAALVEAGRRFPEEGQLESAFYTGAIGKELTPGIVVGLDSTGVALAQQAHEQGVAWRAGQEGITDEQPVEAAADTESVSESVESSVPTPSGRVPGGAKAAPRTKEPIGGGVDVSGPDAGVAIGRGGESQPALKEVPVTKVAPGTARGVKESRRGTQGTQLGRPVRGAAELTAGMQAQQGLYAELAAARARGEISDQETAEIVNIIRPPGTKEEFAALPEEAQTAWGLGIAAQKNMDDRLDYIDELEAKVEAAKKRKRGGVKAARKELEQAKESIPALQKPLDATQEVVVDAARSRLKRLRAERAETQTAIRALLKDPDLSPAQRRDLEVALQESIVTLYERSDGPEMSIFVSAKSADNFDFETGKPVIVEGYHGSHKAIDDFDPKRLGEVTGAESATKGFFFTSRERTAKYYARLAAGNKSLAYKNMVAEAKARGEKLPPQPPPVVNKRFLNLENPFVVDMKRKFYRENTYADLIEKAKAGGHDGLIIKNTFDSASDNLFDSIVLEGRIKSETIFVAFKGDQISKDPPTPSISRRVPSMSRRGFLAGTAAALGASVLPAPVTALPKTINADLTALLEAGDINGALDWVAKNADNPIYRTIAKKIRQFGLGDTALRVVGTADQQWDHNGRVDLDPNTNALLITLYGGKGRSVETFLHEAIHAYAIARWGMLRFTDAAIEEVGLSRGRGKAEIRKFQDLWDSIGDAIIRHNPKLIQGDASKVWAREFYRNPDEALSWAMTNSDLRTFLESIDVEGKPLPPGGKSWWSKLVDYFRELFGMPPTPAVNSAFDTVLSAGMDILSVGEYVAPDARLVSELGILSEPQLFQKAEEDISAGLKKVQNSVEASDVAAGIQQSVDGAQAKFDLGFRSWKADTFGKLNLGKNLTVTSAIVRGLKARAPATGKIAEEIVDVTRQMRGMNDSMTRAAELVGKSLRKWVNSGKNNMQKMATAMQLARVLYNDPSVYASIEDNLKNDPIMKEVRSKQRKTKIPANKKRLQKSLDTRAKHIRETWTEYNKLDAAGKAEYIKQREYYQNMGIALHAAMDGLIDFYIKDKEIAKNLRDRVRGKDIEEESEYEGASASLLPNVYFPFMRFGDYVVVLSPPKGKKAKKGFARKRFHADTPGEQLRHKEYIEKKYAKEIADGTYELTTPDMSSLQAADANESVLLQQMFAAIDRIEMTGIESADVANYKKRARDSVYQVWLMTLPERSIRKQFIHADHVEGQTSDVPRVFASTSTRYASQLPKLIARPQIDRLASEGKESFAGMSAVVDPLEVTKLQNAFSVLVNRAEEELAPPPLSGFVRFANQTAFGLFMSNFMSAFLQTTAFPMQALPRMLVRYGDQTELIGKYIALIKDIPAMPYRVAPVTGERYRSMPSIENTAFIKNNPLRKKLFQEFKLRGFMAQTYTSSVLGRMSAPSKSSLQSVGEFYNTVVSIVGAPVSAMDQLTREMTTMMFAEMEYNKNGGDLEAAVKSAMKNTDETIGDYTDLEQFGAFRGNVGRFFRFLRSYSVQRAVYYARQLKAIYRTDPDLQQTKTQAFSELMLVSGMSTLFGGFAAVAGYSAFTTAFSLMFGALYDDEEKKEFEEQYPNSVVGGKLDADYHFKYVILPNLFGEDSGLTTALQKGAVSYALNADISSRVSQNDLFIRDWQEGDTTFESFVNFATTNLSPQLSAAKGIADGFDMISKGEFAKGIKKLTPGYVGNPLVAAEYMEEGIKTGAGATIFSPEEFNKEVDRGFSSATVQALGAVPLEVGIERERTLQPMFARRREYEGRQQELMTAFKGEYLSRTPDQDELVDIAQDIAEFNASLPAAMVKDYVIDDKRMGESILRTLRADRFRGYEATDGEMLNQLRASGQITQEQYYMLARMLVAERYK